MLAVASSLVVPAIERWGALVTNFGATVIIIVGAMYVFVPPSYSYLTAPSTGIDLPMTFSINSRRVLWATIRFGEELRAYVDVGYSTITDT